MTEWVSECVCDWMTDWVKSSGWEWKPSKLFYSWLTLWVVNAIATFGMPLPVVPTAAAAAAAVASPTVRCTLHIAMLQRCMRHETTNRRHLKAIGEDASQFPIHESAERINGLFAPNLLLMAHKMSGPINSDTPLKLKNENWTKHRIKVHYIYIYVYIYMEFTL